MQENENQKQFEHPARVVIKKPMRSSKSSLVWGLLWEDEDCYPMVWPKVPATVGKNLKQKSIYVAKSNWQTKLPAENCHMRIEKYIGQNHFGKMNCHTKIATYTMKYVSGKIAVANEIAANYLPHAYFSSSGFPYAFSLLQSETKKDRPVSTA